MVVRLICLVFFVSTLGYSQSEVYEPMGPFIGNWIENHDIRVTLDRVQMPVGDLKDYNIYLGVHGRASGRHFQKIGKVVYLTDIQEWFDENPEATSYSITVTGDEIIELLSKKQPRSEVKAKYREVAVPDRVVYPSSIEQMRLAVHLRKYGANPKGQHQHAHYNGAFGGFTLFYYHERTSRNSAIPNSDNWTVLSLEETELNGGEMNLSIRVVPN